MNVFCSVKVVAEIYRPKHHLRNGPITRIIGVWAHLWNIITSIFQNFTRSQLYFIVISRSMNTSLSVAYWEEQEHESLSPIKQLFSTPCLFELSCEELWENIYMLALRFWLNIQKHKDWICTCSKAVHSTVLWPSVRCMLRGSPAWLYLLNKVPVTMLSILSPTPSSLVQVIL